MASSSTATPLIIVLNKSTTIAPASSHPAAHRRRRRRIFLSPLDLLYLEHPSYDKRLLFYTIAGDHVLETLTTSLSAALVPYYPFAGRFALDSRRRLLIDCNDAGVELLEASTDTPMSEISREGFPMMPLYQKLCRHLEHDVAGGDRLYTNPLLSIQVTRFSDGGISVGLSHSHVVADGRSMWSFMAAWAECARAGSATITKALTAAALVSMHERERLGLKGRPPCRDKADWYTAKLRRAHHHQSSMEVGYSADDNINVDSKAPESLPMSAPLVECVFLMPEASIRKLKDEAGANYSTYKVVCAHLWQRLTEARGSPPDTELQFLVIADLRAKLDPPLPSSYFGNALDTTACAARARDVVAENLGQTAARIHEAVLGCSEESLHAHLHWLELHGNRTAHIREEYLGGFEETVVVDSPKFPAYELDFGWGRPAAVRPAKPLTDGLIAIFGGRRESGVAAGDIEICMALRSDAMERLINDAACLAQPISNPFHYYKK